MAKQSAPKPSRAKSVTLVDVAREAGVGTTTVSRVLNGAHYVHADTLARIQAAMRRLGYAPVHAARALKSGRNHTLGLIVPSLRDPFFASLAHDIQQEAKAFGYVVLVFSSADDATRQLEEIDILRSHRVDGAILVPPRTHNRVFLEAVRRLNIPLVAIDRPLSKAFPFVGCDNFEAALCATEHLVSHGRKRILFAGGDPALYTIRERERGYRQALAGAGLEALVVSSAAEPSVAGQLDELLAKPARQRPDAIFGSLNVATLAAVAALERRKLSIPGDVAVLGFDDFSAAELLRPPVSVIQQPILHIGRSAVALLLRHLDGEAADGRPCILPSTLLRRGSCGC